MQGHWFGQESAPSFRVSTLKQFEENRTGCFGVRLKPAGVSLSADVWDPDIPRHAHLTHKNTVLASTGPGVKTSVLGQGSAHSF